MRFLTLIFLTLVSGIASAQPMVESPFRFERVSTETDLELDGSFVQTTVQQIKIQTQAGMQQAGQMTFTYNVSMQKFDVLEARTQKSDGRNVEVKKDAIFVRDLPASTGAPMFADVKVVVVVFPEVALGDSVYAKVRTEQTTPMFPGHYSNLFFITPHLVIDESRTTLRVPAGMKLGIENEGYAQARIEGDDRVTYVFTASNSAVEPLEPGSVAPLDYSRRLAISTFADYTQFARAYGDRAADKAAANPSIQKLADEITRGTSDPRLQAERLYDWVTKNLRYVGIFLGAGAVVPHSADQILANRYGDCKDHVTLLTALLATKGIEASTAVVSLGSNFWTSKLPVLPNFNHVILYVPSLGIWADPTSDVTPFGRLPMVVQGKSAVLVPSGEMKTTPVDKPADNVTTRRVRYEVLDNGTVKGSTVIEAKGVRAERYRATAQAMSSEKLPEYVRNLTSGQRYKGEGTVSFTGLEARTDTVQVKSDYVMSGGIDWPGSGSFEVPAGFRGGEAMSTQIRRSAVTSSRPRASNLVETLIEEYEIRLPAKMKVVALPKDVAFRNDVASFEAAYRRQGQTVYVTRKLVDLHTPPIMLSSSFKAADEKSTVIARDLRAQIVYEQQ